VEQDAEKKVITHTKLLQAAGFTSTRQAVQVFALQIVSQLVI
jgi:hypothetical protein